ncbi:hypothetical protein Enr13x_42730 [Stieleria neptunia]|uniref:Uncharacterized protein n=1 Tax=Stieleria neptunia TaxID=2527979 RepID=A0A518HUC7_9BACT|nr:hypothetical protein [Stieleria neptunia]QDV44407.1 hypothetical protein Enr13x_42730 [Stieleria neptunia]
MMSRFPYAAALLTGLTLVGCGDSSETSFENASPASLGSTATQDGSLVLTEMPEGEIVTPTEIKEAGTDEISVVLGGRIDAGAADPFQPGQLAFMISQLPDEGHGEDDPEHADNCPFCKRKLENAPRAIVQFKGADGSILEGDARQSLALDKGDIVYVTGMAQYNPAVNTVMVNAKGVFRKSEQ